MAMIFEKPIILEGEEGNVVLIYGEHIIGNITKMQMKSCYGGLLIKTGK